MLGRIDLAENVPVDTVKAGQVTGDSGGHRHVSVPSPPDLRCRSSLSMIFPVSGLLAANLGAHSSFIAVSSSASSQ